MSADYPGAEEHLVPRNFMFNSNAQKAIVIHKTAGDATPQAVYDTFLASGNPGKSVHYAVGQDGSIWQYVPESLGAGGNCCTEPGYDSFWTPYVNEYGNLNLCTLSVEHCDPATDNSTDLTAAQKEASFKLVAYLAQKYNIPSTHIKTHASIDPQSRARCPGNYPMDELIQYVQEGNMAITVNDPTFTTLFEKVDDQHYKSKATGKVLMHGNLAYYLAQNGPVRLGDALSSEVETGGGASYQVFSLGVLIYTPEHGSTFGTIYGGTDWNAAFTSASKTLNYQIATLDI
jgi:hypothetical protein